MEETVKIIEEKRNGEREKFERNRNRASLSKKEVDSDFRRSKPIAQERHSFS
jgi:hypothetical protein